MSRLHLTKDELESIDFEELVDSSHLCKLLKESIIEGEYFEG